MPAHSRLPSNRTDFEIRKAATADVPALMRLEADRFTSDRLSRRSFAALVRSPTAVVVVAAREAALLGYAVLLTRRASRSARLYSIAVAPGETGRGMGARLLEALENAARRRAIPRVHLEVRADNLSAVGFYERAGYKPVGKRDGYYADGMDALLYARRLASVAPPSALPRRLKRAA